MARRGSGDGRPRAGLAQLRLVVYGKQEHVVGSSCSSMLLERMALPEPCGPLCFPLPRDPPFAAPGRPQALPKGSPPALFSTAASESKIQEVPPPGTATLHSLPVGVVLETRGWSWGYVYPDPHFLVLDSLKCWLTIWFLEALFSALQFLKSCCIAAFGASRVAQMLKNLLVNARDRGSTPGLGRSHGERNGYPLQYFCLENSTDRGAYSPRSSQGLDMTEQLCIHI